jgi:hypothetical protein
MAGRAASRGARLALVAAAACLLVAPTAAHAVTIDFDVGVGVIIDNFYPGVTFRGFGPDRTGLGPGPTPVAVLPVGNRNVITTNSPVSGQMAVTVPPPGQGDHGILISFDVEIVSLSLVGADFGGSQTTDDEDVTLTAFDSTGLVLGSTFFNPAWAQPNLVLASIAFPGMRHVAFTFSDTRGFFGIDNVEYEPDAVPEPSSLLLVGAGLLGFASRRRRKHD